MLKTKIEWADASWNPVVGCLQTPPCPYCYARRIAHRFGESFEPHWKEKNFQRAMPKKPSRIFVNSMSDIAFWDCVWMTRVLEKIRQYPQHTFLFLTKEPVYYQYLNFIAPKNCWFGVTITNQSMMNFFADLIFETTWDETRKLFFSFEPLLEKIELHVIPDWLIIGAENGNRKGKVIPEREWIDPLLDLGIPIFMKDSLKPLYGDLEDWRQFPNVGEEG